MERDLMKEVNNALYVLGVEPHLKGFEYLRCAIYEILDGTLNCRKITGKGGIYEYVALVFATTESRVERAIRFAKERSMSNLDDELIYEIFGNTLRVDNGIPCNHHFIAAVVNLLNFEPEKFQR